MENKINIAELLKDCPSGMELDCTMFDNVTFERVAHNGIWINYLNDKNYKYEIYLDNEGCLPVASLNLTTTKCVIFPKDKTTWEGFQRPFKDGDIVTWKDRGSLVAFIYKERKDVVLVKHHFALYTGSLGTVTDGEISLVENEIVFATEEEKQKLFDAIKDNGYKWNEEKKVLEKLLSFKVGDRIKKKGDYISGIITQIDIENFYKVEYFNGRYCFYLDKNKVISELNDSIKDIKETINIIKEN